MPGDSYITAVQPFNVTFSPLKQAKEIRGEKQSLQQEYFQKINQVNIHEDFKGKYMIPKSFGTFEQPFIKDDLGRILKSIISLDRDLEELKQMMSLKTDFNLIDTFKLFICNGEEKEGVNLR